MNPLLEIFISHGTITFASIIDTRKGIMTGHFLRSFHPTQPQHVSDEKARRGTKECHLSWSNQLKIQERDDQNTNIEKRSDLFDPTESSSFKSNDTAVKRVRFTTPVVQDDEPSSGSMSDLSCSDVEDGFSTCTSETTQWDIDILDDDDDDDDDGDDDDSNNSRENKVCFRVYYGGSNHLLCEGRHIATKIQDLIEFDRRAIFSLRRRSSKHAFTLVPATEILEYLQNNLTRRHNILRT